MIILFSNCGFAIIAFLFYLCGSNGVAEVFADFIVNNCYLIFAVLLIITFLISFYLVRKNSFKSVKVTATIGFTILDFAKVLIFYLLLVTWSIDFVCHNDVLNSIISLLVIPLDLMFISCICVVPTFIKYAEYGNILNICLVMALDLFLTILFVILIRLLIAESFLTTYSIISSNEWWENILNIARK
jgi:hypothetical protein